VRRSFFIAAVLAAALTSSAQQSSQPVPDAPAPQPGAQKKTPPKTDSDKPAPKDDNAFPEDVSKAAAAKAAAQSDDSQTKPAPHSTAGDNPFPEAESKAAAKAAGNDTTEAPPRDIPPGVSSSRSSSLDDVVSVPGKVEEDPARAKKDAEVGGFYFKSGNYPGALARFQDATTYDPTNVDAIFGLAESQRMLKKKEDAARNYQLYLDIVPNGPKSKQALKALKELGG
jgi:tetratricopeptide (TPR) repeat protein